MTQPTEQDIQNAWLELTKQLKHAHNQQLIYALELGPYTIKVTFLESTEEHTRRAFVSHVRNEYFASAFLTDPNMNHAIIDFL